LEGGAADELLTKVQRLYDQRERQGTARAGVFVAPPSRSPGKRNSEIINSLLGLPKVVEFIRRFIIMKSLINLFHMSEMLEQ
jgi:hypothetical protein